MARKQVSVGLDLGHDTLKIAAVEVNQGLVLDVWKGEILPEREGRDQAMDEAPYEERLFGLLRDAEKECRNFARKVMTAVRGEGCICRYLEFPPLSSKELEVAVPAEALKFVPFSLDKISLSYVQVPPVADDKKRSAVFFVSAPKKPVQALENLLHTCGVDAKAIEAAVLSLTREFAGNHALPRARFFALVHLGFRHTLVVIVRGGFPYYAREVPLAGRDFTYGLQMHGQSTWKESEAGKIREDAITQEVAIQPFLIRLAKEIKKSLDYFKGQFPGESSGVTKVFLSGGTSNLKGLPPYLAQQLNLPVEVDGWDKLKYEGKDPTANPSLYKVAVGLALGG